MKWDTKISIGMRSDDAEERERLGRLRVLLADRTLKTGRLAQKVLFSLGIGQVELAADSDAVLAMLKTKPYDFLILEWNTRPLDGLTLVRAIRHERDDPRIRRDIPIIMMTGQADKVSIQKARDTGVTEFVAKPFSMKAISTCILHIIDNPRPFIDCPSYVGPCRRRKGEPPPTEQDRRRPPKQDSDPALLDEQAIAEAQAALMQSADDFVFWAKEDIILLKRAYQELQSAPENQTRQSDLRDIAYRIHAQASTYGYTFGAEISEMLAQYMIGHPSPNAKHLQVIGVHIDTIRVVFHHKIEQSGHAVARQVIDALRKLIEKLA